MFIYLTVPVLLFLSLFIIGFVLPLENNDKAIYFAASSHSLFGTSLTSRSNTDYRRSTVQQKYCIAPVPEAKHFGTCTKVFNKPVAILSSQIYRMVPDSSHKLMKVPWYLGWTRGQLWPEGVPMSSRPCPAGSAVSKARHLGQSWSITLLLTRRNNTAICFFTCKPEILHFFTPIKMSKKLARTENLTVDFKARIRNPSNNFG